MVWSTGRQGWSCHSFGMRSGSGDHRSPTGYGCPPAFAKRRFRSHLLSAPCPHERPPGEKQLTSHCGTLEPNNSNTQLCIGVRKHTTHMCQLCHKYYVMSMYHKYYLSNISSVSTCSCMNCVICIISVSCVERESTIG